MSEAKSPSVHLVAPQFHAGNTGASSGGAKVPDSESVAVHKNVSSELVDALRGLVVEVEGNIGSGKSTLTETLRRVINVADERKPCIVHGEKVNAKFLTAYYSASKRYAFAFQSYMLTTRYFCHSSLPSRVLADTHTHTHTHTHTRASPPSTFIFSPSSLGPLVYLRWRVNKQGVSVGG